jgi:CRISPR-associated protein Cas2
MTDARAYMPLHGMRFCDAKHVPARSTQRVVIAYDVANERRRRRLARSIVGLTPRVQQSVYEGDLTASELRALAYEIQRLADAAEDSIVIAPLCARCSERRMWLGPRAPHTGACKGADAAPVVGGATRFLVA